ncbi:MFS general substrate transporter [Atractiella rhizophila]|nr:MFS general substrate transporter [Atractiella rhizophila]
MSPSRSPSPSERTLAQRASDAEGASGLVEDSFPSPEEVKKNELKREFSRGELERGEREREELELANLKLEEEKKGHHEKEEQLFLVGWEGDDDPENPLNWSRPRRWAITMIGGLATLNVTFASSAPSSNTPSVMEYFGFSQEVAILLVSLFVAGYIGGPLIWGPGSELFGRRLCFLAAFIPYSLFALGAGLSKNTASILIFRFLGGVWGSCPLTVAGGLTADIWDAKTRGVALSVFALAPFAGPALGPTVGGFIEVTGTSWRWTHYTIAIFGGAVSLMLFVFLPETYTPLILARKAAKKRRETGDQRWWAPLDKKPKDIKHVLHNSFVRPFVLFSQEPMLAVITFYMSFIYGVVYLLFEAYPYIFVRVYGFSAGINGLTFLTISIGGTIANLADIFISGPRYRRKVEELAPKPVPPEQRLLPCIPAAAILPIAMFWLAWSCFPSTSYWSCIVAGTIMGGCIFLIFLSLINYIVDSYLMFAATALAASTVVRSIAGAGFPLFATQMYDALNVHWATSLLAFVALAGAPIPLVLFKFGPKIRKMSKNAVDRD